MAKGVSTIGLCPEHRDHGRDFVRLLEGMCSREGWRLGDGLSRYLEAAYRARRGPLTVGEANRRNEEAYMHLVRRCRNAQETMRDMAKMLGIMSLALKVVPRDFIGPVFSEVAANEALGQFFTPWDVSLTIAKMSVADAAHVLATNKTKGQNYISCHEPACGVGGMILAANTLFREQGLSCSHDVHWHAVDKDFSAYCGTFLQCELTNASAVVIHGDTLTLEEYAAQQTRAAIIFPKRIIQPKQEVQMRQRPVKLRERPKRDTLEPVEDPRMYRGVQPINSPEVLQLRQRLQPSAVRIRERLPHGT